MSGGKALTISTYLFAIISALTAYITTHYETTKSFAGQSAPMLRLAMIISIYFVMILMVILWKCYIPKQISTPGNKPKHFMNNSLLSYNFNYIRIAQLEETESYIDHNFAVLKTAAFTIKGGILTIIGSPLIAYIFTICYP